MSKRILAHPHIPIHDYSLIPFNLTPVYQYHVNNQMPLITYSLPSLNVSLLQPVGAAALSNYKGKSYLEIIKQIIPTDTLLLECYWRELTGPRFAFEEKDVFDIATTKDFGIANLGAVYQNAELLLQKKGIERRHIVKVATKFYAANKFNAIKENFEKLIVMGFTVHHIIRIVTKKADRLETVVDHAKCLFKLGLNHNQIVLISRFKNGNKILTAIKYNHVSLKKLHLSAQHIFQLSACVDGGENIKIISIYADEFIKHQFSPDMILSLQASSTNKLITLQIILNALQFSSNNQILSRPELESKHAISDLTTLQSQWIFASKQLFFPPSEVSVMNDSASVVSPPMDKFAETQTYVAVQIESHQPSSLECPNLLNTQLKENELSELQVIIPKKSCQNIKHKFASKEIETNYYFSELKSKFNFSTSELHLVLNNGQHGFINLRCLYQEYKELRELDFDHLQIFQMAIRKEGFRQLTAVKTNFTNFMSKGFDHQQIMRIATLNAKHLKEILQYYPDLQKLGLENCQIVNIVSHCSAVSNIKAVLKHWNNFRELHFSPAQIIRMAANQGGGKTLAVVLKSFDLLKEIGFSLSQVVELVDCPSGSLNIEKIEKYSEEFKKYKFTPSMILDLKNLSLRKKRLLVENIEAAIQQKHRKLILKDLFNEANLEGADMSMMDAFPSSLDHSPTKFDVSFSVENKLSADFSGEIPVILKLRQLSIEESILLTKVLTKMSKHKLFGRSNSKHITEKLSLDNPQLGFCQKEFLIACGLSHQGLNVKHKIVLFFDAMNNHSICLSVLIAWFNWFGKAKSSGFSLLLMKILSIPHPKTGQTFLQWTNIYTKKSAAIKHVILEICGDLMVEEYLRKSTMTSIKPIKKRKFIINNKTSEHVDKKSKTPQLSLNKAGLFHKNETGPQLYQGVTSRPQYQITT